MSRPKPSGDAVYPSESWDRTHPDHEWWVNGRGWCLDPDCPDHDYGGPERQARGLDGATPTIHVTKAEFHTERFWDERINPVAAAHGMEPPTELPNGLADGDPDRVMLKHPDGRVLLIIRIDREDA